MTEWKQSEEAPRDGTKILVDEGDHVSTVSFYRWSEADKEDLPPEEKGAEGFWQYHEPFLADIAPNGPEEPFPLVAASPKRTERVMFGNRKNDHNDEKRPFRLFEQWGGDDKIFRLIKHIAGCATVIAVVWIIWG